MMNIVSCGEIKIPTCFQFTIILNFHASNRSQPIEIDYWVAKIVYIYTWLSVGLYETLVNTGRRVNTLNWQVIYATSIANPNYRLPEIEPRITRSQVSIHKIFTLRDRRLKNRAAISRRNYRQFLTQTTGPPSPVQSWITLQPRE